MTTMKQSQRPHWNGLTARQRLAAFNMNQDNFEQSKATMAEEWAEFLTCFEDGEELNQMWESLNRQANAFDPSTESWKQNMSEFLACCNRR